MLRALVRKELHETLWVAGIALLAYFYFLSGDVGLQLLPRFSGLESPIPFVGGRFVSSFGMVSVALAIALGLRQTAAESLRGTWLFLLHRPAGRRTIVGLKLAVGILVYLLCAALPILLFGLWAATPGTHASPFVWSMTGDVWQTWLLIASVYFAAFLVGLRSARWFGSRLFPLAATAGLLFAVQGVIEVAPRLWPVCMASVLLLDAWLVANILYVARTRDY